MGIAWEKGETMDLVLRGGRVIDGTGAPARAADVGVEGDRIVAVGEIGAAEANGAEVVDLDGLVLAPGFVDQHAHVHESQLNIAEFAAAVVPHGTVGIGTDFYGEVVVAGVRAAHAALEAAAGLPLKVWFLGGMPAYYQNLPFGHSGTPSREEILAELDWLMDRAVEHLGPVRAGRWMRKAYPWYVERLGGGKALQAALQATDTVEQAREAISPALAAA